MRKESVIKSFSLGATRALWLLFGMMISALASSSLMATDCTSDYIELNSQARIDSFQSDYGGGGTCDTVPGTLRIGGSDVVDLTPLTALTTVRDQFQIRGTNNLTDLDGLSALTSVGGDQTDAAGSFYIFDNAALTSLHGLSALASVGGTLSINGPSALTNLDGLSALTSVNGLGIGGHDSLTDISGISAVTSGSFPGSLGIGGNDTLTNLDALSSLTSVGGNLSITHNFSLTNLDGLSALTGVGGSFDVRGNTALTNITGLSSLTSVGGYLQFIANNALTNLDGLSALTGVGWLNIRLNDGLTNLGGLSALTSINGALVIEHNPVLTSLDGLSALSGISSSLTISFNSALADLDGLSALTNVGGILEIEDNPALTNLDGLSSLSDVGYSLTIRSNSTLVDLDGLSGLTRLGSYLSISENIALANLDGLSSLQSAQYLVIEQNSALTDCQGLVTLVDPLDDHEPGPGPGSAGIPDITEVAMIQNNSDGCNSVKDILGEVPLSEINSGLNDAWINFETNGQGFLITVFPEIEQIFMAWFTYDTERPPEDITAILGEPGHRWLTAQGEYIENFAELTLYVTAGGVFDSEKPAPGTESYGELLLEFSKCNAGVVTYDIPSLALQGVVPIERVTLDNVPLCYVLDKQIMDSSALNE